MKSGEILEDDWEERFFSDKKALGRFLNKVDFQTGKMYDLFDRPFTDAVYEGRIRGYGKVFLS